MTNNSSQPKEQFMKSVTTVLLMFAFALGWFCHVIYEYIMETSQRQQGALAGLVIIMLALGGWYVIYGLVLKSTPAARQKA
jgi:hypothetical protein